MPGVLAAAAVLAPVAAQDRAAQTQPPAAAQDEAPQAQLPEAAQNEALQAQPQDAAQGEAPQTEPQAARGNGSESLDRFLEEAHTLRAEFSQELLDGGGNLIEEASGTFALKRPNRFLWSYAEPFEQQVVADAANLWIHDVELAQITVSPLDGAIASSPAMLLSGDGQVRDGFEVAENVRDGLYDWVTLTPIAQGVDFRSIQVGFDAGELFALVLVDALGQVTSIEFHDVTVNLDIEDEYFQFNPPAGTDVIGEPVEPGETAGPGETDGTGETNGTGEDAGADETVDNAR